MLESLEPAIQTAYLPTSGIWGYRQIHFNAFNKDILAIVVLVSGDEYQLCAESSKNQWSNSKKGVYGEGLLRQNNDPFKPNRIGKLGELAFSKVYRTPIDLSYRRFGDKFDVQLAGMTVDIKTAATKHGNLLVRVETENGKKVKIDKDLYVAQVLLNEQPEQHNATVAILGYAFKDQVEKAPLVHAVKGAGHKNKQIRYDFLNPIDELEKLL